MVPEEINSQSNRKNALRTSQELVEPYSTWTQRYNHLADPLLRR